MVVHLDLFCKLLSVQVLATAADPNLGGRNFDEILMDHFVEDFKVSGTWQQQSKLPGHVHSLLYTGHLIGCGKKNGKLCRNFRQYYAEESDDYAEKTPDYAEISKINKAVPLSFLNT